MAAAHLDYLVKNSIAGMYALDRDGSVEFIDVPLKRYLKTPLIKKCPAFERRRAKASRSPAAGMVTTMRYLAAAGRPEVLACR